MRDSLPRTSAMRLLLIGLIVALGIKAMARRGTPARPAGEWPQRARRYYDLYAFLAPHWAHLREAWQAGERAAAGGTAMDPFRLDEARSLLGVRLGATRDEINAAYRDRMRRYHPDQGGSAEMASRINAARDMLLGGA